MNTGTEGFRGISWKYQSVHLVCRRKLLMTCNRLSRLCAVSTHNAYESAIMRHLSRSKGTIVRLMLF